jgi:folylpolyglutamate synthase
MSGRSGAAFLETILKKAAEQLESYKSEVASSTFFSTVIFCTNVTYADGHFKGGTSLLFPSKPWAWSYFLSVDLTSRKIETEDADLLRTQRKLADTWLSLIPEFPAKNIHVLPSIEHAIRVVRGIESDEEGGVDVLVTGSLHLVGGVIEVAGLLDVAL